MYEGQRGDIINVVIPKVLMCLSATSLVKISLSATSLVKIKLLMEICLGT